MPGRHTNNRKEVALYRKTVAGAVVLTNLLSSLLACYTYVPREPVPAVINKNNESIWVIRKDGTRILLEKAAIVGDSLVGVSSGKHHSRISMGVPDIASVEVRHLDTTRTIVLGVVGAGVIALVSLMVSAIARLPSKTSFGGY